MSECNPCALISASILCAGFICLCIYVVPRDDLMLIIALCVAMILLVVGLLIIAFFGYEIRRRCCACKKNEPLLDLESQTEIENREENINSDETVDRRTIINKVVTWRSYEDPN